jgi:hypothetical protein
MTNHKTKPWVVYQKKGLFANPLARFSSESEAIKRKKEILRRVPNAKLGIFFERPKPIPYSLFPITENETA